MLSIRMRLQPRGNAVLPRNHDDGAANSAKKGRRRRAPRGKRLGRLFVGRRERPHTQFERVRLVRASGARGFTMGGNAADWDDARGE